MSTFLGAAAAVGGGSEATEDTAPRSGRLLLLDKLAAVAADDLLLLPAEDALGNWLTDDLAPPCLDVINDDFAAATPAPLLLPLPVFLFSVEDTADEGRRGGKVVSLGCLWFWLLVDGCALVSKVAKRWKKQSKSLSSIYVWNNLHLINVLF